MYTCPVCLFKELPDPPHDFEICPSCGTEFGYHDRTTSYLALRQRWVENGARWNSRVVPAPDGWNGWGQLIKGGAPELVPFRVASVSSHAPSSRELHFTASFQVG